MPDIDENIITLNPTYLPMLFSSIISMKNQFVRSGILLIKDLKHIWVPPEHPESLHSFFLSLLETFELLYLISEDRLLIPALLSPIDPDELRYVCVCICVCAYVCVHMCVCQMSVCVCFYV
jgi:hypothetical protein